MVVVQRIGHRHKHAVARGINQKGSFVKMKYAILNSAAVKIFVHVKTYAEPIIGGIGHAERICLHAALAVVLISIGRVTGCIITESKLIAALIGINEIVIIAGVDQIIGKINFDLL
jgi:hypothetical protein